LFWHGHGFAHGFCDSRDTIIEEEPMGSIHPTTTQPAARPRFDGLWRHRDFMRLWAGQTVSELGSTITREALPYTAILALHATPIQMGLLGAAGAAPLLLFGLLAGVWVDRLHRRPLMIATDLARALLILSVPAAFLLGWLDIGQLYVVAALAGVLTVFFDTAYTAYLPSLVAREHVVEGNSKLGISSSLAEIGGTPLGGALVQLIGGPITLLLDAASFLVSAGSLARIRTAERAPEQPAAREHIGRDMATGLRAIWADRLLRPIAISTAVRSFFGWFFGAIYGLYALNALGMSPFALGLTVACGGIGSFLGAVLVRPLTRRLGFGRALAAMLLIGGAAGALTWLAGGAPTLAIPLMMAAQIVGDLGQTGAAIGETSLRQTITPARLLGRVSGSMNVLGRGVGTLGLLAGGVLAELIGLRATIAVASLGGLAGNLVLVFSAVRRLRELPEPIEE
jgi:Na+/melibiose symporter-like transporter